MEIVNRVAQSEIMVFDLGALWDGAPVVELDIASFLVEGIVLKEKIFRSRVEEHDWAGFSDKHVAAYCSTDAIVPTWAYLLVATRLQDARSVAFGRSADLVRDHFARALEREDWSRFEDRLVVIKGCGSSVVPTSAYLQATELLQGVARKLMYGEPCSSVPLWRRIKASAAKSMA